MSSLKPEKHERFLSLLEPIRPAFARFCRALCQDREQARDLASESILILFQQFDSLRERDSFKSYLFTTALRLFRRQRHRERNRVPYDPAVMEQLNADTPAPDARADVELLYQMLEQLPPAQKEAVILFEIAGLSLEEVRQIQGGSLSGVKSRIARGREALAELLGVRESAPVVPVGNGRASDQAKTLVYARTVITQSKS